MSKEQIVMIARRILESEIDPLEGCRSIVHAQGELSEEERRDQNLMILAAIESETDHFAMGAARQHWNSRALAEQDHERVKYLERNRGHLFEACRALIAKFE